MNKTREEILNKCHLDFVIEKGVASINTKNFPEAYKSQALNAMSVWASRQAIAFDKWKVEEGWEWSSSKWFKSKEVFWHQVPVGEYLTTDQLWCKFIEHQIKQSSKN